MARKISSRRRKNPALMIGNPRTKLLVLRNARRKYSRRSNPGSSIGSFVNREMFSSALVAAGGFTGARFARDFARQYYPVGLSPTTEGALNIGVKLATAGVGGLLVSRVSPRYARSFAFGAVFSAIWDGIALVTGKPMSLAEYVAPNAVRRRLAYGRAGMGSYPLANQAPANRMAGVGAAFSRALPKAF